MMTLRVTFCLILFFFIFLLVPGGSWSQKADPTITGFKVEALYRAAKVTWKTKGDLKNEMAVQILRADSFEDGAYQEVGTVKIVPGKSAYEYVDKSMGSEAKYFYKLVIKDSNESFGPLPTRPFFSPPAT
ncbi:MAG TPA: hypothetical protein VEH09_07700 [Thermodesulfobacteriota bacterium]|nr:hypothetical protein [Thermodesulfobacteriota bacterium]